MSNTENEKHCRSIDREKLNTELVIKVFAGLEKPKKDYTGWLLTADGRKTVSGSAREKDKWCCPDPMAAGEAEAAALVTELTEQEPRSPPMKPPLWHGLPGLLWVPHLSLIHI